MTVVDVSGRIVIGEGSSLIREALRVVIDLVPDAEEAAAAKTRADKRAWLAERGYRIIAMPVSEIESDMAASLARIDRAIS